MPESNIAWKLKFLMQGKLSITLPVEAKYMQG